MFPPLHFEHSKVSNKLNTNLFRFHFIWFPIVFFPFISWLVWYNCVLQYIRECGGRGRQKLFQHYFKGCGYFFLLNLIFSSVSKYTWEKTGEKDRLFIRLFNSHTVKEQHWQNKMVLNDQHSKNVGFLVFHLIKPTNFRFTGILWLDIAHKNKGYYITCLI